MLDVLDLAVASKLSMERAPLVLLYDDVLRSEPPLVLSVRQTVILVNSREVASVQRVAIRDVHVRHKARGSACSRLALDANKLGLQLLDHLADLVFAF